MPTAVTHITASVANFIATSQKPWTYTLKNAHAAPTIAESANRHTFTPYFSVSDEASNMKKSNEKLSAITYSAYTVMARLYNRQNFANADFCQYGAYFAECGNFRAPNGKVDN